MKPGFQIEPFPEMRRMAPDIGWLTRGRYTIRGLLEIDVTRPRQLIREHKARTGEALSFTAFLAACTGRAVDADRRVQAMRNWRGSLVIFDEVDSPSWSSVAKLRPGGREISLGPYHPGRQP